MGKSFFCSNNYGPAPDYSYMNYAVQNGTKMAATTYPYNDEEYNLIMASINDNCFALPYDYDSLNEQTPDILFVSHKGTLADYFDISRIENCYKAHGVLNVDWNYIKKMSEKDMKFFSDSQKSGIMLQSVSGGEKEILVGLILGYPIESTIASLLGNVKIFKEYYQTNHVKEHFTISDEPFKEYGDIWKKENGCIFIEGQQESLYFD